MKKQQLLSSLFFTFFLFFTQFLYAQLPDGFDIHQAYQQAKEKGISNGDVEGYVAFLHNDYLSHKAQPLKSSQKDVLDMGTIYLGQNNSNNPFSKLNSPNSPQNVYCPNAGFEQFSFANWNGEYGKVSNGGAGAPYPLYNLTSATIVNPAGNNVSLVNSLNYHTIMTTAATNSVYPNCTGYDSIACTVIGTQTVSEIPVVNPTGGPASVRLNGALANYRASKLTYNMSLNPNNKNFSISYALVLENGSHTPDDQPYFSVKVTDQNGNLVPGCSVYTVTCDADLTNSASPLYDPTWSDAVIGFGVMYRKWQTFAFDFSNYPTVTSVNVEFYVGGCAQSGHFGYAYVDAACSQGGAVASFCAGSNTSVLTAPIGYNTYQWIGPSGPVTTSNGGNTGTATISPVSAGQVFTCNVTASNGCASSFQTTVAITSISITAVNSTPSCLNGSSGTANVSATGSSSGYVYQWLNSSGSTVGNAQSVAGLSPGTYSITVSSALCGSATTTVNVGVSPPTFYPLPAPFCGSVAWITKSGGSNYKWYTASPLALIPGATSSSLTINSPVNGTNYFLVYTTASGCKDSIKYTLTQQPGGSIYVSNVKSICAGNNNSYAVINLQTSAPPAYSYSVTGPSGYNSTLTNTTSLKDSVTGLSVGTYSAIVFDGQCLYNTTFTVSPFVYSYTLTPQTSTLCSVGSTSLAVNFGTTVSSFCGLDPAVCLTGSPTNLFSGPFTQNGSTTYPAPYGNWYTYGRSQYLIRQSDLTAAGIAAGKISSLAFNVLNLNTSITSYPNFYIKMGCTSLASLPDVTNIGSQPFIAGLQTVYSNANQPIALGWVTHNFSQAYVWDGVSNIIVEVCFGMNTSSNYSQNASIELKQLPYVASMYHVEDTSPACSGTQPANNGSGSLVTSGQYMVPNMKLGYCGGQNTNSFTYTWSPGAGLSSASSYSTLASPTVTTIYTVQVSPIGQTNCIQTQTAAINIITTAQPTITAAGPYCDNYIAQTMTVNPSGGTWSALTPGSIISAAGQFSPNPNAVGTNTLLYTLTSGSCTATNTVNVEVIKFVPATITGALGPYCIYDSVVNLQAIAQFTGGIWAGPGVNTTSFTPSVAGANTHIITYSTNPSPLLYCGSTESISIVVNAKPEANVVPSNLGGCNYPWTVNFLTTTVNTGITNWDFGDGTPNATGFAVNHIYNTPGTYTAVLTYTDLAGCKDTTQAPTAVTIYSFPIAAFEPSLDVTTIINSEISFTNQTSDLVNNIYTWDFSGLDGSHEINPVYLFVNSGQYTVSLIAVNANGCQDTAIKTITVNPDVVLYVPNAFTPGNNDGLNDVFQIFLPPTGVDYSTFNLLIYDRWGELVYSTNDVTASWTGAKKNTGPIMKQEIYVWKINFQDLNKKFYEKMGHVSLLHK